MSGAEAVAALGVISSIIAIVDGTKRLYDAAKNASGLPEAFREVAGRLPIVREILRSTYEYIDKRGTDAESCRAVKDITQACEKKVQRLDELFHKAISADGASDLKRYYKAVRVLGKGNEVEGLMKEILEDLQLLVCDRGMQAASVAQQEQIMQAITDVSVILPSVPEHELQESDFTNMNSGPGTQYNAQGEYIAQGNARQYNSAGGTMNFVGATENHVTTQNVSISLGLEEDEAQACLSALFLTDPQDDREKLVNTKGFRVSGTCEWIKCHALYKAWLRSDSRLLWLSGGPGKGKTIMSIFLAEELERTIGLSQDKVFLQYFCDNSDQQRNTAVALLRGLIYQLLKLRPRLFTHILPSFRTQKKSLFSSQSFEALWRIFENMICDPTIVTGYCVLDGLDECDEVSLQVLLRKLVALIPSRTNSRSKCHLNILILSRNLPDCIPDLLSQFPHIALDSDTVAEITRDIDVFIDLKVQELSELRHYPRLLCEHVEGVLRSRAQGTFLWVGMIAQELRKYKVGEVEHALELFPSGLDGLYARILLQIDSSRQEIAAKILRWVAMAVRLLTISEIGDAIGVSVSPSITVLSRDEIIRDQISYCGYLLVIREDKVDFIHQSAKDYLLRKSMDPNPKLEGLRVKENEANLDIARKCLKYLQSGILEQYRGNDFSRMEASPLLLYATTNWYKHARNLDRSEDIFDLSLPFWNKDCETRKSWARTFAALPYEQTGEFFLIDDAILAPLDLASRLGILPLAENIVVNEGWAAKNLRLDASFLGHVTDWEKALWRASSAGHDALVRLLIESGANIHTMDKNGLPALKAAAWNGHEAVVQTLLRNGADIEVREGEDLDNRTALISSAYQGRDNVVRILLDHGAKIEAWDRFQNTALMIAAELGNQTTVQLLLERGANIKHENRYQEIALVLASERRHAAVVQLLLEKGAELHGEWTGLLQAARGGKTKVVQLLLENRANINERDQLGDTALTKAAFWGQMDVVQLLLDKGADIEAKDNQGTTALIGAAGNGHNAVVQLLLEKGANINHANQSGDTALIKAAFRPQTALAQLLLEKGADINAKGTDGRTALLEAVKWDRKDTVRLLLEKGASIDRKTKLMLAASRGLATVKLLLKKGAISRGRMDTWKLR